MQSLKQVQAQIHRYWGRLPAWLVPVVFALVIASAAALLWQRPQAGRRSTTYLLSGRRFTDSQLGPMLKAFSKAKLTTYVVDDRRIRVPHADMTRYLAALADSTALPRDFQDHTDAALSSANLFETDRERQRRLRHANEKNLAQAIGLMPGIENAMVTYDEAESQGFQSKRLVTACVAVLPADGYVLDRQLIRSIRLLIAGARAGLEPGQVSITDLRSRRTWVGEEEDKSLIPRAEELLEIKRSVERDWQHRIRLLLTDMPAAEVVVRIELPDDSSADTPVDPQTLIEPSGMSILIGLPESHVWRVWRSRGQVSPTPSTTEPPLIELETVREQLIERIRQAVLALIPQHLDSAVVTVTRLDDLAPAVAGPWWQQVNVRPAWQLISEHQVAAIVVSSAGAMVFLASLLRRRRRRLGARAHTIPIQPYQTANRPQATEERLADAATDLDELRVTLVNLVRDDPDGAAQVLNRWLDRAG